MSQPLFALRGVSVRYGGLTALADVDFEVGEGERVAVVGPSGAGKSTLLGLLNGAVQPSEGRVEVLGKDLSTLSGRELRSVRRRIGTISQQFDLVGPLRVVHNVNAGHLARWPLHTSVWSLLRPRRLGEAEAALRRVGVADKLHERTDRLSGGEQQRVALARVLVQDPVAILADEPISSLDPERGREVMDLLRDLVTDRSKTLVVSVHAFVYALSHCDRVIGLRGGRVTFDLPASQVDDVVGEALYRIEGQPAQP
ncbi:MAG: phosphonate ABC transporter ATP-binding protein [Actinobacteria bacterium]|nr:phosphonate ABC transporter ATP-binding protein [Actinomycetota bacterium]